MEYLVIDLLVEATAATAMLNRLAEDGWRVVGTLYYGGISNSVILERVRE